MKKIHYSDLVIGEIYYLDESKNNIGLLLEINQEDIIFMSLKNRRFSEHDGVIGFATFPNLHFYEIEKNN